MTVATAALVQSLKISAKPEGRSSGEGPVQDGEQGRDQFLDLLQTMRNGGIANSSEGKKQTSSATGSPQSGENEQVPTGPADAGAGPGVPADAAQAGLAFATDLASALQKVSAGNSVGGVPENTGKNGTASQVALPATASAVPGSPAAAGQSQSATGKATPQTSLPNATETDRLFSRFAVPEEAVSVNGKTGKGDAAGEQPTLSAGSVKILRQETHFAPTQRLSPIQQIGERLILSLGEQSGMGTSGPVGIPARTEGPVLKTLEIQLTPVELGTVKVSMRLVGENVEVTVRASNPQTAEMLKQDRQMLDQMLRSTGYKPDAITVQSMADDRPVTSSSAGQHSGQASDGSPSQTGQGFGGAGQNSGQSGGRPQGAQGDPYSDLHEPGTRSGSDAEADADHRDDGVYL